MQANTTIRTAAGFRAIAVLDVDFDLTPGQRGTWDDAGWEPELGQFSLGIVSLKYDSGTEIDYNWLESRGWLGFAEAALYKIISNSDMEYALGNLNDYLNQYDGD